MKNKFFGILLMLLTICNLNAQNIDSLKQALINAKEDTSKIYTLYSLSLYYKDVYPDRALPYLQEAYQRSSRVMDNNFRVKG